MKKLTQYLIFLTLLAIAVGVAGLWVAGQSLSRSVNAPVAGPPEDLAVRKIVISGVHGWFVPVQENTKCVLLMHPIRTNRTSMIDRARFLREAGYSTLLIDLQAHGETPGDYITFGFREAESARIALRYLRETQKCRNVASIGNSLGAAASLLGDTPLAVDAYILEALFPTIEDAIRNRLEIRLGAPGRLVAPLFYYQIPVLLDIPLHALHPVEAIQRIQAPVLVVAGSVDRHTPLTESMRLYDSAPDPKQFLKIDGAHHTDFYRFAPELYRETVLRFLAKYLSGDST